MQGARVAENGSAELGRGWSAGLLRLFALAVWAVRLGRTPVCDESYRVPAARSCLEHHTLSIAVEMHAHA